MRPIPSLILLVALSVASSTPAAAQIFTGPNSARQADKAGIRQQKALNKASRKQQKAANKYQKAQRKAAQKAQRRG